MSLRGPLQLGVYCGEGVMKSSDGGGEPIRYDDIEITLDDDCQWGKLGGIDRWDRSMG